MAVAAPIIALRHERPRALSERRRWRISGRVQGVGFRPFVYRCVRQEQLTGFVLNDGDGVIIEAQGDRRSLERFAGAIVHQTPRTAAITGISVDTVPLRADEYQFAIASSQRKDEPPLAQIAPDLAVCPDCVRELRDPRDRQRFGYALVNCTYCGPRFSIIRDLPYDRSNTTMAGFPICECCRAEYTDPSDRRFHAQPVACRDCGPRVELIDARDGMSIPGDPISGAAELLAAGGIVAVKGIGGYHLAVRADDEAAIARLRRIKHRLHKPLALMTPDVIGADAIVVLSSRARDALASRSAPIILAPRKPSAKIASSVAPGNHRLGVIIAYTPIHHLIFDRACGRFAALVMTSANDSDEPLVYTDDDALARLGALCDAILRHDRPIERPVDDSVLLDCGERELIPVRRSRGYVPVPLALPQACQSSGLALGGELKNTVAVVRRNEAILSQHLGDLRYGRSYENFQRTIRDLLKLLAVKPLWVAHDLHPAYLSTRFATELGRELGVPCVAVQHHHAHAAAVLAEHCRSGPALAVVCDGTGYGTDGTIWGGELLAVDLGDFQRLGHLRQMRLPGGDATARHPWRSAMSVFFAAFGAEFGTLPIVAELTRDAEQARFVEQMILNDAGCVDSSSCGRLFDGVAAMLGLSTENYFEAQAPMALESLAASCTDRQRSGRASLFELKDEGGQILIDFAPVIRELVARRSESAATLAALFHEEFVAAWDAAVVRAVEATALTTVVLSGGTFCNQIVDSLLADRLMRRGLEVLRHQHVPPNDGGLALGQAAVAAHRAASGVLSTHSR